MRSILVSRPCTFNGHQYDGVLVTDHSFSMEQIRGDHVNRLTIVLIFSETDYESAMQKIVAQAMVDPLVPVQRRRDQFNISTVTEDSVPARGWDYTKWVRMIRVEGPNNMTEFVRAIRDQGGFDAWLRSQVNFVEKDQ